MRRMPLVALAVVLLALAGCSQVAAIAPVGGTHLAEVRFAAIDALVGAGIELGQAPTCTEDHGTVTCAGTTADGQTVQVDSAAADPSSLTVTVGDRIVYQGSILDVLDKAARAT